MRQKQFTDQSSDLTTFRSLRKIKILLMIVDAAPGHDPPGAHPLPAEKLFSTEIKISAPIPELEEISSR